MGPKVIDFYISCNLLYKMDWALQDAAQSNCQPNQQGYLQINVFMNVCHRSSIHPSVDSASM